MRSWAKMKLVAAAVCVAAAFVAARQAAAAEPAAQGVTILDDNTYWRWIGVVKPTVVEAEPGAAALSDLEGKTVEPAMSKEWGDEETDQIPPYYVTQVAVCMAFTMMLRCESSAPLGTPVVPPV